MSTKTKSPKKDLKKEKQARLCKVCGTKNAIIRKYNLNVCRRCFKEIAEKLGFRKYG